MTIVVLIVSDHIGNEYFSMILANYYAPVWRWGAPTRQHAFDLVSVLVQSEAAKAIPVFLRDKAVIDFTKGYEEPFARLRDHIHDSIARRTIQSASEDGLE